MVEHKSLTAALAAFQADLPHVGKGSINPHFKSKYAALEDIVKVVLPALAKQGLSWVTLPTKDDDGSPVLAYKLMHVSGDVIEGKYPMNNEANPQKRGSELTYLRRYALSAVTGIAPDEDDDGNAAAQAPRQQAKPEPVRMSEQAWQGWNDRLNAAESADGVRAIWQEAQKLGALNQVTPDGQALGAVIQARAAVLS